jgi:hypothetical protein
VWEYFVKLVRGIRSCGTFCVKVVGATDCVKVVGATDCAPRWMDDETQ